MLMKFIYWYSVKTGNSQFKVFGGALDTRIDNRYIHVSKSTVRTQLRIYTVYIKKKRHKKQTDDERLYSGILKWTDF